MWTIRPSHLASYSLTRDQEYKPVFATISPSTVRFYCVYVATTCGIIVSSTNPDPNNE